MTASTRRTALSACLALGLLDLLAINLVLLPARRQRWVVVAMQRAAGPSAAHATAHPSATS